jgi:hypothetical protein
MPSKTEMELARRLKDAHQVCEDCLCVLRRNPIERFFVWDDSPNFFCSFISGYREEECPRCQKICPPIVYEEFNPNEESNRAE